MEGQLKKKKARGIFGSRWTDCYFVLDGTSLRFYAGGSTESELKGEVIIASVDPRDELQGAKGHAPNRFDFNIADGSVICASALSPSKRLQFLFQIPRLGPSLGLARGAPEPPAPKRRYDPEEACAICLEPLGDAPQLPGCSHRLHAACVLGPDSLASHAWAENRPSLRRGQQVVCPVCRTTSWIPPGFL